MKKKTIIVSIFLLRGSILKDYFGWIGFYRVYQWQSSSYTTSINKHAWNIWNVFRWCVLILSSIESIYLWKQGNLWVLPFPFKLLEVHHSLQSNPGVVQNLTRTPHHFFQSDKVKPLNCFSEFHQPRARYSSRNAAQAILTSINNPFIVQARVICCAVHCNKAELCPLKRKQEMKGEPRTNRISSKTKKYISTWSLKNLA